MRVENLRQFFSDKTRMNQKGNQSRADHARNQKHDSEIESECPAADNADDVRRKQRQPAEKNVPSVNQTLPICQFFRNQFPSGTATTNKIALPSIGKNAVTNAIGVTLPNSLKYP